ncbi:MAG: hypothetical protein ACRYFX_18915 [Janthinobacterium lividum]
MADLLEPVAQEPSTGPGDPPSKRVKFLTNFQKLAPDVELDEKGLNAILADPKQRDEFVQYVGKLNPKFKLTGEEFADELGYGADVKKNFISPAGSLPSGAGAGAELPADAPFESVPQPATPDYFSGAVATAPAADALGQRLLPPGANGLQEVVPNTPGSAANPAYLDSPANGGQIMRGPTPEEQQELDKLPALRIGDTDHGGDYPPTLNMSAEELGANDYVALPPNYSGGNPVGTVPDLVTGLRYFPRPLSSKVNGQEQSLTDAVLGTIKNATFRMAAGAGEGAQAALNLSGMATNPAATLASPATFGDEFGDYLNGKQTPIAPLYAAPGRSNYRTNAVKAAEYAPMVTAQVLQTVVPALRGPAAVTKVLEYTSALAFDADMLHTAHEQAKAAGLQGVQADLYTTLVGGLTIGGFKAGSKLMGELGDNAVSKFAPSELREAIALDATKAIGELEAKAGRRATQQEVQQALSQSVRANLPRLAQVPKQMLQQAPVFGGVEAARIAADQVVAPMLEGKAEDLTLGQAAEKVLDATKTGALIGGITGGVDAALPTRATGLGAARGEREAIPAPVVEPTAAPEAASPAAPLPTTLELPADAPAPPAPASPVVPEPSPAETPVAATPAPEAEPALPEPLPAAEPHPDHVKPLTAQQRDKNGALDALDRYNALNGTERRSKNGQGLRKEAVQASSKAGFKLADKAGKLIPEGRPTRSNEYTGTTPAGNHVPLAERPEIARPFLENVMAAAKNGISVLQGIGVELRGKPLSATELEGARQDIEAGKNTMRAQLVLDALENAHRRGTVEKSEGTGLATRKYSVPVEEYVGAPEARTETPADLTDDEVLAAIADKPGLADLLNRHSNSFPEPINYVDLAHEFNSSFPDPETEFGLTSEEATEFKRLVDERAQQQSRRATEADNRAEALTGAAETDNSLSGVAEPGPRGEAERGEAPEEVTPAAPVAAPTEARKAEIRADIDAASERIKARRAARKAEGKVLSSVLGIGEIDPEDLKDALTIVKGHVQLGVLGIKNLVAQVRQAGLDEEAVPDKVLEGEIRRVLTGDDPAELPVNEPDGSETRKSMTRLDADPARPEPLKQAVRDTGLDKYEPKSVAETEKAVDAYMARNSLADAYTEAISTTDNLTGDVRTALRVRVLDAVGKQLADAVDKGDTASADTYLEQSLKVAEALAKRGTDAGREINAYKLLVAQTPEATVYQAQKDVAAQREKEGVKLGKKLRKETKDIAKAKREALDNALATPTVRAAREKVAGKQPTTTGEKRAAIRAERDDLFSQLRALSKKGGQAFVSFVPITPQQAQAAVIHVKIFRTYLQEGLTHITSMVERFKREAGPMATAYPTAELRKQAAAAIGDHDEAIRQGTAALGTTLDKIARDHLADHAAVGKSLAQQFVEGAGLSPADAKNYADAIEAEFARRIKGAQQRRLDELTKRAATTPTKRASQTDLDKTRELFTLSPTDDAAILDHLKRVNDLPELTVADVAELRKLAGAIQDAPEGFQKDAAVGELLKRQAQIKGISWLDKAGATWYANILFALKTHGVNIFANTGQLVGESSVSTIHGLIPGSKAFKGRYAFGHYVGLAKGLLRGGREAASVLATGREVANEPGKYDIPGVLEHYTFAGGKWNPYNYGKYVGRALRGMDVLFSTGLKEMRAYEMATMDALADKKNGIPTPDVWAAVAEKLFNTKQRIADAEAQAKAEGLTGNDLKRRIFELAEQSRPIKLVEDSREYGTRAVFNGDPKGASATIAHGVAYIADNVSIGGVKPLKLVVPFTRVVSSVANAYMDYTPIGAVRAANSLVRAKHAGSEYGGAHITAAEDSPRQRLINGEERERLLARAVIGTAAAAVLYQLSHDKDENGQPTIEIIGNGTGDPEKDAQLKAATGWMPNAIRYKGVYYGFSNTPLALPAGMVGNVNDAETYHKEFIKNNDAALDRVGAAAFQSLVGLGDITAVRGPRDFLQATKTPKAFEAYLRRMAASTAMSAFPASNLVQETAGRFYDHRKEAHTFAEAMQRNIPGARNGLHDAIDVLGDPLPAATPRLWNRLERRDEQTERLWAALAKHKLFISVPSRQMGGTLVVRPEKGQDSPMTDDEFYKFMADRGAFIKAALLSQITTLEGENEVAAQAILEATQETATLQSKIKNFGPGGLTSYDRVKAAQLAGADQE